MKNQKGFTIIELMFVLGILGVLAAIALPVYFDYTTRAKVAEGFSLADRVKTGVTETYLMSSKWEDTNARYGLTEPTEISGTYVKQVEAVQNVITITYNHVARKVPGGSTVLLTATYEGGSVIWDCSSSIASKYLPANCR